MALINNGVYTMLMKDVFSSNLLKFACHSLAMAISYAASECLSSTFIIAESHNWFSKSSIRRRKYCSLYKAIDDNKHR